MWTIFEIGNSNLKIVRIDKNLKPYLSTRVPLAYAQKYAATYPIDPHHEVVIAGSGPGALVDEIAESVSEARKIVTLNRTSPVPFKNRYASAQAGVDRLANAAAVISGVLSPCIVVDAGSAVTVDLVLNTEFFGGYILPGLALQATSLNCGTASLPNVEVGSNGIDMIPTDTAAAISRGIFNGVVGAIRHLVHTISQQVDSPCRVVFTGGDGNLLFDCCNLESAFYDEFLTAKGLLVMAQYQETGES